jgi:hypothetical protein
MDLSDLRYELARARARLQRAGTTPRVPRPGLPDGLDASLLEAVCRHHVAEPPALLEHVHLSPFKAIGGAHRVLITTPSGRRWSLIHKECRYGPEAAPGAARLGLDVGPQEYAVYTSASQDLRRFLPRVYHAEELEPGMRYRYLLEDLSPRYHKPVSPRDLRAVVAGLGAFGTALDAWAQQADVASLFHYDRGFMVRLRDLAGEIFDAYQSRSPVELPNGALLTRVLDTVATPDVHGMLPAAAVHGDLNRASVLLRDSTLKVVDWEWTGFGVPHMDLAILLEHADARTTRRGLACFTRHRPQLSVEEHAHLFHWARAATCTLVASVLAAELLAGAGPTRADRPAMLRRFLRMAVEAASGV